MTATLSSRSASTGEQDSAAPHSITAALRAALVEFWHEIVRSLIVGLVALLSTAPGVFAAVAGAPLWLVGLATLPFGLAMTGVAAFAATVSRSERASLRSLASLDPFLAVLGALLAGFVGAVFEGAGPIPLIGAAVSAGMLLVAPVTLAYGALRERRGFGALRGGLILVAYRPGWALSLLALACVGGFAVAASVGVLMLVIPVASLVVGCAVIGELLRQIDSAQEEP